MLETFYTAEPTADGLLTATAEALPAEGAEPTYALVNGGFENGLDGWTLHGEQFAKVSSLDGYWSANNKYFKDGNNLFTGLEGQNNETDPNLETKRGVLRSSMFKLKAGGWVSFKLGAAKNITTGIRFVNARTGAVIGKFINTQFAKINGNEGQLIQYKYKFDEVTEDTLCYVEIFDEATGDWGLVAVDSIITDHESEPTFKPDTLYNETAYLAENKVAA